MQFSKFSSSWSSASCSCRVIVEREMDRILITFFPLLHEEFFVSCSLSLSLSLLLFHFLPGGLWFSCVIFSQSSLLPCLVLLLLLFFFPFFSVATSACSPVPASFANHWLNCSVALFCSRFFSFSFFSFSQVSHGERGKRVHVHSAECCYCQSAFGVLAVVTSRESTAL